MSLKWGPVNLACQCNLVAITAETKFPSLSAVVQADSPGGHPCGQYISKNFSYGLVSSRCCGCFYRVEESGFTY